MKNKTDTVVAVLCVLACVNVVTSSDYYNCYRSKHAMKNFDVNKWSGHWYYVSTTGPEKGIKCLQNFNTPLPEGGYNMTLVFSMDIPFRHAEIGYGEVVAENVSNTNEGIFNVTLAEDDSTSLGEENPVTETLYVFGTDYENYAVTYGCNSIGYTDHHFISILSRTPQLDEEFQSKANEIIFAQNLDPSIVEPVVQDCGNLLNAI